MKKSNYSQSSRYWRKEYSDAKFILNSNDKFIVGREVEKMSKSKYNVVNPDDVIDKMQKFGAC